MYVLLIVDDEPEVANCLYDIFQRLKQPELIVYKSYSAKEALELMNRAKIDIVLTDIRMPGMTGLNLFERIKENWPQCRVIFLTGFREFDYVYSAIQKQGVRYLLKTEKDDKIIGAVQDAIQDLENSLKDEDILAKARQRMDAALPLLQKQYYQDILDGICTKEEISQEKLDELKIPIILNMQLLLLIGRFDNFTSDLTSFKRSKLLYSLKSISDRYIIIGKNTAGFELQQSYAVWLLQPFPEEEKPTSASWNKFMISLKGHLEYIQAACRVSLGMTVSFALSSQPFLLGFLPEKLNYLKQLLANSTIFGKEMILTDKSFSDPGENKFADDNNTVLYMVTRKLNKLKLLENYLESGQKNEFVKLLGEIIESLRSVRSKSSIIVLEIYYSVAIIFLNYINRWNLAEKIASNVDLYKLTRINEFNSWSEAVDYLYNLTDVIFEIQFREEKKKAKDSVTAIQQHIYSHLAQDLTLVRLADIVNLNPSYLSRLFKEVTGENLSDYINEIRINRAKELLSHGSKKINEISCEVGYESPHSFARFFRNVVGISPQMFRDSFSKKE